MNRNGIWYRLGDIYGEYYRGEYGEETERGVRRSWAVMVGTVGMLREGEEDKQGSKHLSTQDRNKEGRFIQIMGDISGEGGESRVMDRLIDSWNGGVWYWWTIWDTNAVPAAAAGIYVGL